mgnify:CR=1 FL=1
MIKQVSLFLENKNGSLARVCKIMGEENINIRALSIADTTDFGVLRLIVNDPESAVEKLKDKDFLVSLTEVVGIKVQDKPGSLSAVLDKLEDEGVAVEYMYAFYDDSHKVAQVILRLSDNEKGICAMKELKLDFLSEEEAYRG